MRLIDADKLLESVGSYDPKKYTWEYGMVVTVEDIKHAPTVDAEPVKHGKWIDTNEGTCCSECCNYPYDDGEFHILHWRSDFCPHCGAKMDEVTK